MTIYKIVVVVTGEVEATSEVHARQQVLMGVTLSARLLQLPHDIAIKVTSEEPTKVTQ